MSEDATADEITFEPVNSSSILKTIYYPRRSALVVVFQNNLAYEYENVPRDAWDALVQAPSQGSYVAKSVRGKYEFKKVPVPQ